MNVEKREDGAAIITITGDAGTGKTTAAAYMPNPVFIVVEDGLRSLKGKDMPMSFPKVESSNDLWGYLTEVIKEKHEFKTLVIDSVTALEALFTREVIESDSNNPKSLNQALGGFGAGFSAVAQMHERVRKACEIIKNDRGMNVVFVAHADIETITPPDSDSYNRYSLRLNKKSCRPYIDDVDLVGFIRLKTFIKNQRAISGDSREIVCHSTPEFVSKNRFGLEKPLDFVKGKNPFEKLLKGDK